LFPGLKDEPGLMIPMAPIDRFWGISALADESNLAATIAEAGKLDDQGRAIDSTFRYDDLQPLASMSWQGRIDYIKSLQLAVAATYYRVRGDIRPLQVEVLQFLQDAVDKAYDRAEKAYNDRELKVPISRNTAIGNDVDGAVRERLKLLFENYGVPFGPKQNITINNRDASSANQSYRIPDARLGRVSIDWSLAPKTVADAQVRGFFAADSEPDAVIIVRPSQLGPNGTYIITRPASLRSRR
jgi:hypothetical protein